jgi:hypothetical protein
LSELLIARCSFCRKSQHDVRKMIAGPNVYICDECVDICLDIIAEPGDRPVDGDPRLLGVGPLGWSAFLQCRLCSMPTTLSESLAVPARGIICPGCVGAFEAALAERDAKDSP